VHLRRLESGSFWLGGAISMSQGFLLSSMLWSATVLFFCYRKFFRATIALLLLAACSWIGTDPRSRSKAITGRI
jgi:hypothetical protein